MGTESQRSAGYRNIEKTGEQTTKEEEGNLIVDYELPNAYEVWRFSNHFNNYLITLP